LSKWTSIVVLSLTAVLGCAAPKPASSVVAGASTTRAASETPDTHEQFLRQAIALAREARSEGNHPFGALLVLDGKVVLTARNSVSTDRDPTAHAETNLVARAIRELARKDLGRAVLYTSCEPCAMCVGKMYWAGVRFVVYALSAQELAVLAGPDFLVPCRDLFARATETVTVLGPMLVDEARAVHVGFWNKPAK